jgi:hypothetical protein
LRLIRRTAQGIHTVLKVTGGRDRSAESVVGGEREIARCCRKLMGAPPPTPNGVGSPDPYVFAAVDG